MDHLAVTLTRNSRPLGLIEDEARSESWGEVRCGRGGLLQQLLDVLRRQFLLRIEVLAAHVSEEAVEELAGDRALVQATLQVYAAKEQPALTQARFKEETQLAVFEPVVDHLHDWP